MSRDDQVWYHTQRAMRELDQGLTAGSEAAARAHLQLSSLHMQRARALGGGNVEPSPPFIMA